MKLFGKEFTRREAQAYFGNLSQFAGIKPYSLTAGKAKGTDAFDVKTGSGLNFTVLPGRAMDIAWMDYKDKPVSYMTKSGITAPEYYDPAAFEWLRGFYGGILTTCGLTQAGDPDREGIWELGQHGRISNTPAEEVSYATEWQGDELVMTMRGKMREAVLYEEDLLLARTITSVAGRASIRIDDTVSNNSFHETPFMIIYHINVGHPVIGERSRFVAKIADTGFYDEESRAGYPDFRGFCRPDVAQPTNVFFHDPAARSDGTTMAGVINDDLKFGFYIKYNKNELPHLTQWKNMQPQDYVMGLEPGNCTPVGRNAARKAGMLRMLKPGEAQNISIEMGVLDGQEQIDSFCSEVEKI